MAEKEQKRKVVGGQGGKTMGVCLLSSDTKDHTSSWITPHSPFTDVLYSKQLRLFVESCRYLLNAAKNQDTLIIDAKLLASSKV